MLSNAHTGPLYNLAHARYGLRCGASEEAREAPSEPQMVVVYSAKPYTQRFTTLNSSPPLTSVSRRNHRYAMGARGLRVEWSRVGEICVLLYNAQILYVCRSVSVHGRLHTS